MQLSKHIIFSSSLYTAESIQTAKHNLASPHVRLVTGGNIRYTGTNAEQVNTDPALQKKILRYVLCPWQARELFFSY